MKQENTISLRALGVGTLFAIFFAILTVYFNNRLSVAVTANQIAVLPYLLMLFMVLILNPLCRLIRVARCFSLVEIMIVFVMGTVSSGVSTFGLTEQLVPIVGSLFNQEWNTSQSEWNRYVVPFVNDRYFVSEPGIQSAADTYRRALDISLKSKSVYDAAQIYDQARIRLSSEMEALKKAESGGGVAGPPAVRLGALRMAVATAQEAFAQAEARWAVSGRVALESVEDVLKTYPPLMEAEKKNVLQARQSLAELQSKAFEKARLFRRGLPRGLRAYPGIIPMAEDDFHSYGQRLKRTVCGRASMQELKQAQSVLKTRSTSARIEGADAETLDRRLAAAAKALIPATEVGLYEQRRDTFSREEEAAIGQVTELEKRLTQMSLDRRGDRQSMNLAKQQMAAANDDIKRWKGVQQEAASARERSSRNLEMAHNVSTVMSRIEGLRPVLRQHPAVSEVRSKLADIQQLFPAIEGSVWQYVVGDVPWSHWASPLLRWGLVILLTYIVLMSLNVLIFRQWAYNEKLTYPLVELPKSLVSESGIPPMFRMPIFWIGLALSAAAMGWIVFCKTHWVSGLQPFELKNAWLLYLSNTAFDGLKYGACPLFFTMIGLSFLVPKNISFSLWFFYILKLVELQLLVWNGQGVDARSFPSDWWYLMNYATAQGQGALLVFSTVVLYKCRKYILCAVMPAQIKDLEAEERMELKMASFLFLFCSLGLILLMWLSLGANLIYAVFFYLMILLITIGLVRAVTEGGLLSFQCQGGPFHFVRSLFGLDKSFTSASLFAPLMVYYAILFIDIKTFIAPVMANSLKLRDDFKMSRGRFHVAVILAVVLAGVTGIVTAIMMCYSGGADTMQSWFYTSLPRDSMFGVVRSMTKDAPPMSPALSLWIGSGAAVMAALLYARQFVFWLPHPIGLVMYVNPIMDAFWFSIFLGWLINVAVTKFGNKETLLKGKHFFIGLIIGEMLMVVVSIVLSIALGMNVAITLNR